MRTCLIISFLFFLACSALGQNKKLAFSTINQGGVISGSKGDSWTIETINGIKKANWFTGVGAGLDFYDKRTVPLFLDVRRDVSNKKNTPFVYADAGINFLWLNTTQKEQSQFPKSSPGLFYDFGLGWKLSCKDNRSFILSAGYSLKQVKENIKYPWVPIAPTQQLQGDNDERYNYLYRRIVIKIGFML